MHFIIFYTNGLALHGNYTTASREYPQRFNAILLQIHSIITIQHYVRIWKYSSVDFYTLGILDASEEIRISDTFSLDSSTDNCDEENAEAQVPPFL
jgi:hypothetical protein